MQYQQMSSACINARYPSVFRGEHLEENLQRRPSHQVVVVHEPQLEHSRLLIQGSRAAASPCTMRSSAALLSCTHRQMYHLGWC